MKFYFHCLANVELKLHTKVLRNLFHNMALKNLCVTPIVSNETILATKQEFFFTKVAPVQSITDIVPFGF